MAFHCIHTSSVLTGDPIEHIVLTGDHIMTGVCFIRMSWLLRRAGAAKEMDGLVTDYLMGRILKTLAV